MEIYDGFYEIKKYEDGYYVEVTPPKENGKKIEVADVVKGLQQQNIEYDLVDIIDAFENIDEQPVFKVSDFKELINSDSDTDIEEKYTLTISEDQMNLYLELFPVKNDNEYSNLLVEIIEKAKKMKITVDINSELINEILSEKKYNNKFIIASGVPVINAQEASIEYNFKTEKDYRPEVDKDGNVNYHKLHIVANVTKDQLLATLTPGFEGKSGINVIGQEIKPKSAKFVKLKRGKNVRISDDGTKLYSEIDGLVKIEDDKVVVNNTFNIPGNVGSSTGDVEFQGTIIINGNVSTGYKVTAKGDVEVIGVVEGAVIEAGGNVLLHRGVQGMSKSLIKAGGNVMARYIENAEVIAGGMIHSEAILHSIVSAKEEIKVEGKKGMISGGTVRSGIEISANILGSNMGTATNVQVGIDPLVWEEYNDLLKELPKFREEEKKLEQVIVLLNKRKEIDGELDEQKKSMYISATRNKIFLNNKISISEKRLEELEEEVDRRHEGKIKVTNMVYPGVRATIGTSKYFVRDEIKSVCMIRDGADIKLMTL